jgi:hypothetical protein
MKNERGNKLSKFDTINSLFYFKIKKKIIESVKQIESLIFTKIIKLNKKKK